MISDHMTALLNKQIEIEAYGSFYYLSMAAWCDRSGLSGCSQFFLRQAAEEHDHMMRIFNYLLEVDSKAEVPGIQKAPVDFEDIFSVFQLAYDQEKAVTRSINQLVKAAIEEEDHSTHNFLQWYVEEQREEEAVVRLILDKLKLIGDGPQSLYFIDKELDLINAQLIKDAAKDGV